MNPSTATHRCEIQSHLFPEGIPRLWCPTLTHFHAAREPDAARIRAHLATLAPFVRGILVPGSTGEGWEMSDEDIRGVLSVVLDAAAELGQRALIGILKTSTAEVLQGMDTMEEFQNHAAFAGFTICPAKGGGLEQGAMRDGLAQVLARKQPTALYQLPQVTQNEMSAATVASLAEEFPNFILFKDTSGADRVAQSGVELGGVFLVRGAEAGGYASWPKVGRGPYDGFLLSTANVFAPHLAEMLRLLDGGESAAAQALSAKLQDTVSAAFAIVADFPHGNAFANANKVLDHCLAYGEAAVRTEPPLLYSGARLPAEFIEKATALLRARDWLPARGYMA